MDATQFDPDQIRARTADAVTRRWPGAELRELRRLPGGTSSLTFIAGVTGGDPMERDVVVKLAPPDLPPVGNRDVLRQARLLRLLAAVPGVRVPAVLLEDDGDPPLFIMDFLPGDAYEPLVDVSPDPPGPAVVTGRAEAASRMLGHLHLLDPAAVGIGEPAVPLEAELARWTRLFATVDDAICPGHEAVQERLSARLPNGVAPRVLHGDYRMGNILFDGTQPTAIIDWEIWGVGDPRTDLAWLLMLADPLHRFHEPRDARNTLAGTGMPALGALLQVYERVAATPVDDLDWFLAYVHYKMASILSAFVKRDQQRPEPDPTLLVAAGKLPGIIARAGDILGARDAGTPWHR